MTFVPLIRRAVESDLMDILELYKFLNPNDLAVEPMISSAAWSNMLSFNGMTIFVAQFSEASPIVATCILLVAPNLTRGARSQGIVENVVTHAKFRKMGFGRAIVATALETAWRNGCYRVSLTAGNPTEVTYLFYESLGFKRNTKTYFEIRSCGSTQL